MDRIAKKNETSKRFFGDNEKEPTNLPDQEYIDIVKNFALGETVYQGNVPEKLHHIALITALTTHQLLPQLKVHIKAALNCGLTQDEIKETLYQCTPYIGAPRVLNAVTVANEAIKEKGLEVNVIKNATVTEETRFDEGLKVQKQIFGDVIDTMRKKATPSNVHIQDYLSAYCFGDFYTRGVLDLKTREIITLVSIASLGGCDPQVKAHVAGNKSVGNPKQLLIDVFSHLIQVNGFPRTLNALSAIEEVYKE